MDPREQLPPVPPELWAAAEPPGEPPVEPPVHPGDETAPGSKQAGADSCPRCQGTGSLGQVRCPDCDGTGTITVIVGDA